MFSFIKEYWDFINYDKNGLLLQFVIRLELFKKLKTKIKTSVASISMLETLEMNWSGQ